jgi:hypothetical protein
MRLSAGRTHRAAAAFARGCRIYQRQLEEVRFSRRLICHGDLPKALRTAHFASPLCRRPPRATYATASPGSASPSGVAGRFVACRRLAPFESLSVAASTTRRAAQVVSRGGTPATRLCSSVTCRVRPPASVVRSERVPPRVRACSSRNAPVLVLRFANETRKPHGTSIACSGCFTRAEVLGRRSAAVGQAHPVREVPLAAGRWGRAPRRTRRREASPSPRPTGCRDPWR